MPAAPRRHPRSRLAIGLVLLVAAGAAEDANWQRLRSMPREQRVILSKKIEEFDGLARQEKTAIRALDERLATLPPTDQANYRAVMRRYHLWLQGLPADQKERLNAAPTDQKMALVARFRSEQGNDQAKEKEKDPGATSLVFQLADLRGRSPFDVAHLLEIWFALAPAQQAEVTKAGVREREPKLREFARRVKVPPKGQLTKAQEEAALKHLDKNLTKGYFRNQLRKTESEKPLVDRRRLANNYHFLVNPPPPVDAANLFRFESAMPAWIRTSFDHLPPEEAKRRLTILYRLIYPAPKEISRSAVKPEGAEAETAPGPKGNPNAKANTRTGPNAAKPKAKPGANTKPKSGGSPGPAAPPL